MDATSPETYIRAKDRERDGAQMTGESGAVGHLDGRRRSSTWQPIVILALIVGLLVVVGTSSPTGAAPCDSPGGNEVACENTKTGSPQSEWGIVGAGDPAIQGFATDISVDQGGTVRFKIDTTASSYRLDIYRMGFYGGDGARLVGSVSPFALPRQPPCLTDTSTGLVDCGNWSETASWVVPGDAVSGIYFAKLVRTDGVAGASHVFFVVRDDDGRSDLLFQTSDTTWQAYNDYGGNSLYTGSPAGRAYKVSYNRPFTSAVTFDGKSFAWIAEYPMVRFLESNGYDVSYTTGVDTDRSGAELLEHQVFLSVGHDEYWSGQQRANVEAARDAGVDLAFFSGNEVFWKTRWENSIDGSGTSHRTLVAYKDTHANQPIDPTGIWTGTWRDPRFGLPPNGGRPENELTGTIFTVNCCAGSTIDMVVGAEDGAMRFWRNTRVANLTGNQVTTVGTDLIGYEWDEDLDNGFRPDGLFRVSETVGAGVPKLIDYGSNYATGNATHSMTMYRAPSGALVFGAGTVQWAWGLDSEHTLGNAPADPAAQQATVNLLADMGVQPVTLRPGLLPAIASTDVVAPTSIVLDPAAGSIVQAGQLVTVRGVADDVGGSVGGVEVSVDGGTTWHRAEGRENWSYSFVAPSTGAVPLLSRAIDDSGNIEQTTIDASTCRDSGFRCSIWSAWTVPANEASPDPSSVELGVKFRASAPGFVSGIRFYKGPGNTGSHVGHLWTSTGTELASVTFTGESASGWQEARFSSPVPVEAGVTYVASYSAPNGHYAYASGGLAWAVKNGPLAALASAAAGGNGVYRYGGGFPSSTSNATNYYVDVVFDATAVDDVTAPTVVARTPSSGSTDVAVGVSPTATFSEAVNASSVRMSMVPSGGSPVVASASYDAASRMVTLTPAVALAAGTAYTVSVWGATDGVGNVMAPTSWTFTTAPAATSAAPPATPTPFVPVVPTRVLDTRDRPGVPFGQWDGTGQVGAGSTVAVPVRSAGVAVDATAVVANITTTRAAAAGFITVFPCGQRVPEASNLNYLPDHDRATLAYAPVSTDGRICLYTSATTDLIVDVTGFTPALGSYTPRNPVRLADTRSTGALSAEGTLRVSPPTGSAQALAVTVTSVNAAGPGFLTAYSCADGVPASSTLNFDTGRAIANLTIVGNGDICVTTSQQTDVLVDLQGAFTVPIDITKARLADSRSGAMPGSGSITVLDPSTIPAFAGSRMSAVNVTSTRSTANGFLTVWNCADALPNASALNYQVGKDVANLVMVRTSSPICVHASSPTDIVLDLVAVMP